MKKLTLILMLMNAVAMAQNGKASTTKKTFSRETTVTIDINADVAIIWSLLTNAADFPRWNSTIVSLEGNISKGELIRLKSTLDEKRIFKIKVKELIPEKTMIWGDNKGNRVFKLSDNGKGGVTFEMTEKMGGLMFPMYAKFIPPFDESFEQFAADLKKEAELISQTK